MTREHALCKLATVRSRPGRLQELEAENLRVGKALRETEKTVQALLNVNSAVFFLVDTTGTVLALNETLARTLGKKADEILGARIADYMPPELARSRRAHSLEVIRSGKPVRFEDQHEGRRFENRISPIFDGHGKVARLSVFTRDITDAKRLEKANEIPQTEIVERKRAGEKLRHSREQLRSLSARLQTIRQEERTRLAREIHDELGQALTALKIDLCWLARRLPKESDELVHKTASMSKLVDATVQSIRNISSELRPGILDDLGLTAAIEWQMQEFERRTGVKCRLLSSREEFHMDKERTTAVFRMFQETLTNVARHARASRVSVTLKEEAGYLILIVTDNGRGITKGEISSSQSLGLLGMRERALLLGGRLEISGRRGRGTALTVRIPKKAECRRQRAKGHESWTGTQKPETWGLAA